MGQLHCEQLEGYIFLFKADACCPLSLAINSQWQCDRGPEEKKEKERNELQTLFTFFYYLFMQVRYWFLLKTIWKIPNISRHISALEIFQDLIPLRHVIRCTELSVHRATPDRSSAHPDRRSTCRSSQSQPSDRFIRDPTVHSVHRYRCTIHAFIP